MEKRIAKLSRPYCSPILPVSGDTETLPKFQQDHPNRHIGDRQLIYAWGFCRWFRANVFNWVAYISQTVQVTVIVCLQYRTRINEYIENCIGLHDLSNSNTTNFNDVKWPLTHADFEGTKNARWITQIWHWTVIITTFQMTLSDLNWVT